MTLLHPCNILQHVHHMHVQILQVLIYLEVSILYLVLVML